MNFRLVVFCIILIMTKPAWCGLFFEPFAGYENGTGKYEVLASATLPQREVKLSGSVGGFRFGAKVSSFWLGLEPSYSSGTINSTYPSLSSTSSDTYTQAKVHGLLGWDSSRYLRLWAGVGVYNVQKEVYSTSEATITNNSYKAGLGLRWKHFGVNFEYLAETPTKIKDSVTGDVVIANQYSKISLNRGSVSFSWIF